MKLLKSSLIIILSLLTIFSTACFGSGQPATGSNLVFKSNWLKNIDETGVGEVLEECVYEIKFEPIVPEDTSDNYLTADLSGTLTTRLEKSSYQGTTCYKFSTSLSITGEYVYTADNKATVNDVETTTVYFLGIADNLTPLYSEKYLLSTVPSIATSLGGSASFGIMEYTLRTTYNREEGSAIIDLTCGEKATEGLQVPNKEGVKIEDYAKEGTFFDNESLLFIPRAAELGENGFASYFYTLSALDNKIQKMYLSLDSTNPTSTVKVQNFKAHTGHEVAEKEFTVYNVKLSIANTFAGSSIELFYSTNQATDRRALVKMKTQLAFSAGNLVYTLKSISFGN